MDPIKNVGAADYAVTVPQQNQNQVQGYEDYSSMPMVYEPEVEEKKKASSNMLGLTALGVAAAVGIGVGIYKHKQVKGLNNQITELTEAKDALTKQLDDANKKIEELTPKKAKNKIKDFFKKLKFWGKKDPKNPPADAAKPAGSEPSKPAS